MNVFWSKPAVADLDRIDAWLSRHASPDIAARTLSAIRYRSLMLADFPRIGRPYEDFRILLVPTTPYLIFYQIIDEQVRVARIRHEREDWQFDD